MDSVALCALRFGLATGPAAPAAGGGGFSGDFNPSPFAVLHDISDNESAFDPSSISSIFPLGQSSLEDQAVKQTLNFDNFFQVFIFFLLRFGFLCCIYMTV